MVDSETKQPTKRVATRSKATINQLATQTAAEAAFAKFRKDEVEYCAFAGSLGGGQVFEIWYVDGEWCTSFIVLYPDRGPRFFESIQVLLHEVNLISQLDEERRALTVDRRIRLIVGSFAFLLSLCVVLWRSTPDSNNANLAAIVGVLASGCVAIFGVWVPSTMANRAVRLLAPGKDFSNGSTTT